MGLPKIRFWIEAHLQQCMNNSVRGGRTLLVVTPLSAGEQAMENICGMLDLMSSPMRVWVSQCEFEFHNAS